MRINNTDYNVSICGQMTRDEFEKVFPNDKKAYSIILKSLGKKEKKELTEEV